MSWIASPPPAAAARLPHRALLAVAAGAMVAVVLVGQDAVGPRPRLLADPAAPAFDPCPGERHDPPMGRVAVWGDLDGRGCAQAVYWSAALAEARVTAGPHTGRYAIGAPGDRLVLGDWDGDGDDTPALYRPATGEVFRWNAWASGVADEPAVAGGRHDRLGATPTVDRGPPGTPDVVVLHSGSTR